MTENGDPVAPPGNGAEAPTGWAPVTVEGFDGREIFAWATDRLRRQRLPMPRRPSVADPEYEFPDDPEALTLVQLGQLMLRYAGYAGYTYRLLGILESELVALEREYRLKVGQYGIAVRERLGGRPAAETVEAHVLAEHTELLPLVKRLTELETVRANLKRAIEAYTLHWQALSREQARRSDERRM